MNRSLLAALVLAPSTAFAWESESQPVSFTDDYDVFNSVEYTTGVLPNGSPVGVRFTIDTDGGVAAEVDAVSQLSWPEAVVHELTAAEGNAFTLFTTLTADASVVVDLWGYTGTWSIMSESIEFEGESNFDSLLLPGGEVESATVEALDVVLDTFEYEIEIYAGVSIALYLDIFPLVTSTLRGLHIDTADTSIATADATAVLPLPNGDDGEMELESTYTGEYHSTLDAVFLPQIALCAPFVGCYNVAEFEVPFNVVDTIEQRTFEESEYTHPLPVLGELDNSVDVGEFLVGDGDTVVISLDSIGMMTVEGTVSVEGEGFQVFSDDFQADPGGSDEIVVEFEAPGVGEYEMG